MAEPGRLDRAPARAAVRLAAALACAGLLAGCVEYDETLLLERDGSGRLTMRVSVNEAIARTMDALERDAYSEGAIVEAIGAIDGLAVLASETTSEGATRRVHLEIAFDSIPALNRLDRADPYRGLFGRVTLTEDADDNPVLTRAITIDAERFVEGTLANAMLGPVLDQYAWRYEARLPTRVIDTDGTVIDEDAHAVEWTMTLRDVVAGTRVIRATYAKSGLGAIGVAVAAGLMILAIAVATAVSRRRRRGGVSDGDPDPGAG